MSPNADYERERDQRRRQFVNLISAHSEARYAAGWCSGIEEDVREQRGIWLALAVTCAGWPKGYEGEEGWDPLTPGELDAWARIARRTGREAVYDALERSHPSTPLNVIARTINRLAEVLPSGHECESIFGEFDALGDYVTRLEEVSQIDSPGSPLDADTPTD